MQQITPGTVETALTHAERWPMTVGFFLAVGLMAGLAYWLLFKFWPAWLAEQEKHRQHVSDALKQRGVESAEDIRAARDLAAQQHAAVVKEIGDRVVAVGGRVDDVHAKVSGLHDTVRAIASKLGAVAVAVCLFGGGFVGGFAVGNFAGTALRHVVDDAGRVKCRIACASGFYCCGEDKCCERDKSTASVSAPSSSLASVSFASFAAPGCNFQIEVCH